MKLSTSLAALALLGIASAAHADLIKQGSTYHRDFLAYDTSGNNLTASAVGTFTVQQSAAGAAPVTITPTITYKGAGHFDLVYTPALDNTLGSSALIITAPGATQVDINDQVTGFDPGDAAALGLTKVGAIGTNAADSPNEVTAQGTLFILGKRTLNRQTYNPATKVLQLLNDDGTNFGPPLTLTIDANNNIMAR